MYNMLVNSPFVNISVHIVSIEISSLHGLPLYVWVFGLVGWLAHLGKLGWSTLCIHFPCIHFALAPWCASCLAGVHVCVCTGETVVPTPEEGTESFSANCYLLGTVCPCLPGLETTTARSCHQSANVVGEIYTETLKKQKDWGKKNSNSLHTKKIV